MAIDLHRTQSASDDDPGAGWHARPTEDPATDPTSHDEDRALADAVLAGDRDAFRALVEREASSVIAACRRILGDPAEAEDVAQDAFLIAYRKLGAYRADGPLGGWLMRIAIREARDRGLRRRPLSSLDAGDGWSPAVVADDVDGDPVARVESAEQAAHLRAAIAELPAHYRDAVRMRYLDELSFDEIAASTGRSGATVRTHLHRGLARLRSRLAEEGRS